MKAKVKVLIFFLSFQFFIIMKYGVRTHKTTLFSTTRRLRNSGVLTME